MMDIESILSSVGKDVEAQIERLLPRSGIKNLNDAIWYHLGTGGKGIRPALAISTFKALGGSGNRVLPFAAACELMHNWFLVHDDIEDGDTMRRDKETVWKKYGLAHGINVGDYMSEKVYELILETGKSGTDDKTVLRLLKEVVFTALKTAEGQTRDINLRNSDSPTEDEYIKTVEEKTGYYMTLPIVGGAVLAGASENLVKRIKSIGMKIGPAFQIADDLLDMTEGKGRGETGSDIKEGKRSILVVHCSGSCSNSERLSLFSILNKPREATTREDILFVKSLFEKHGSIKYAQEKASRLIDTAKKEIATLPENVGEILNAFADYIIERKK